MKKTVKTCPNDYEHRYWEADRLVIGIDEAGRGPLAGPLVCAGVVFPAGYENPLIYDSKAISEKKREALFDVIIEDALEFMIVIVPETVIDELNIYRADQQAFLQIAETLCADAVLTDAMPLETGKEVTPLVKGDQKSVSIAAGSILAKVTRDRIMAYYDTVYPQYGFLKNKGYPTKQHLDAIEKYGITKIHRKSYGPVQAQQMKLDL